MAADSTAKDTDCSIVTAAVKLFVGGTLTTKVSLGGEGYLGERRGTVKRLSPNSTHRHHASHAACAALADSNPAQLSARILFSVITRAHFVISA